MSTQGGSYSWNAICKVCGFQYKGQDMRRRWDGLEPVCKDCWEPRHPLDFYRTHSDFHKLPWQTANEDVIPDTGLSYAYVGSPEWSSESANNYSFYNYWITRADCRPVALRYYHDGLYTQANSPLILTLWTAPDFAPTYTLRHTAIIPLLPNHAEWVEVPVPQSGSGITFATGDFTTYVIAGVKHGSGMTKMPLSVAGTVSQQTYLTYQDTYYSTADTPNSVSSLGSVVPVDVVVKPADAFSDVVYP